jgi:hypothetical protein
MSTGSPFRRNGAWAGSLRNDVPKFKEADRKWDRNAEDIAEFLSKANPNWPKATLTDDNEK